MKKQILVLIIIVLAVGCKKTEQKNLPVQAIYILRGDSATFYAGGVVEGQVGSQLILESGVQTWGLSANGDTLYKDLWIGDKLTISAKSHTSIYYKEGSAQGYLADSSANRQVTVTVQ